MMRQRRSIPEAARAPCKTCRMRRRLREVAREFALGEAPLETLRLAARDERLNIGLAEELLRLIADWENSPWSTSASSRDELRERVRVLVPAQEKTDTVNYTAAMYGAGIRGQRRKTR
jgi:hypothetical protein